MHAFKYWVYDHPITFYIIIAAILYAANTFVFIDVNQRDNRGRTALYLAAETGDIAQVKSLLTKVSKPDQRDDCQWTPLMRAAQNGHLEVAEILLQAGADINAIDKGGYSVLMVSSGFHNPEIIKLLIKNGANLNTRDSGSGLSALIWAVKDKQYDNAKILVNAGADASIKDNAGKTALDWAKEKDHSSIIELLVKSEA